MRMLRSLVCLCVVLSTLLVVIAAGAAEPVPIKIILDNPMLYANKQVTVSGVPANPAKIEDPLSEYVWSYDVQDATGTIAVKTKGTPPTSRARITISGTLEVTGGKVAILQGGIPPWAPIAALVVLILLAALLVFLIVRKPAPRPAAGTVAAGAAPSLPPAATRIEEEYCEECGSRKPVGQPCPKCARSKAAPAPKTGTVEVKPKSEVTELIDRAPALAWLAIREGDRVGRRFDVTKNGETVGRAPDNTISLDDSTVSRQHAKIAFEDGRFFVHDLASSNKTKVNGAEVVRQEIKDGDEVEFGSVKMVFKRA